MRRAFACRRRASEQKEEEGVGHGYAQGAKTGTFLLLLLLLQRRTCARARAGHAMEGAASSGRAGEPPTPS